MIKNGTSNKRSENGIHQKPVPINGQMPPTQRSALGDTDWM